ncbi:DUF397 domain-containing protein [Amycolatopsis sp. NPDC048633]|uniref:DUF397 domain-containing protein n=1 Tax=Amycolatopsis sp. NPDC048633 TaxID=3157095 RepID=UPI0033EA970C
MKRCLTPTRGGWRKSSHSNASGSCVEVMFTPNTTLVRDSKDRRLDQPVAEYSSDAWTRFLENLAPGHS